MPPPAKAPSYNFGFLAYHDPRLSAFGADAERLFAEHPAACLGQLRLFGEVLARNAAARFGMYVDASEGQAGGGAPASAGAEGLASPGGTVYPKDRCRWVWRAPPGEGARDPAPFRRP